MEKFKFYQPTKIHFGAGALNQLGTVVKKHGDNCLLVTTEAGDAMGPLYDRVKALLKEAGLTVHHFAEVVPNPPIACVEKAIELVREQGINVIVGVGGGSALDAAKCVSLLAGVEEINWQQLFADYTDAFAEYEPLSAKPALPVIAVPTTAGTGSEVTQAMVISDPTSAEKNSIFHDKAFPKEAVIDPEIMATMPAYLTAVTGFDAFSHAFESLMRSGSTVTTTISLKALELVIEALPPLMKDLQNVALREKVALAATLAGISLSNAGATMPHPLAEIIGGIAPRLPHGQCLASLYPRYIPLAVEEQAEKCAAVARLFRPELAAAADAQAAAELGGLLENFLEQIGLNKKLSELGVTTEELDKITSHFLLGVLPFAPKETLVAVITESY